MASERHRANFLMISIYWAPERLHEWPDHTPTSSSKEDKHFKSCWLANLSSTAEIKAVVIGLDDLVPKKAASVSATSLVPETQPTIVKPCCLIATSKKQ